MTILLLHIIYNINMLYINYYDINNRNIKSTYNSTVQNDVTL